MGLVHHGQNIFGSAKAAGTAGIHFIRSRIGFGISDVSPGIWRIAVVVLRQTCIMRRTFVAARERSIVCLLDKGLTITLRGPGNLSVEIGRAKVAGDRWSYACRQEGKKREQQIYTYVATDARV